MEGTKMSLKLLIDSRRNKVVFAEAGKVFVDLLLTLLSLPVGTVIRVLTKPNMVGCIANLYESLEDLNESYLQPNQNKDSLLKPTMPTQVTNPSFLLPGTNRSEPENLKLYYCTSHPGYVSHFLNTKCSRCRRHGRMSQEVQFVDMNGSGSVSEPTGGGGYVKDVVTYMVTDDLSVSPTSMVSVVALLNRLSIENLGVLHERVVKFGIDEGLELLKASFLSKNALTDVFLPKQQEVGDDGTA